MEYEKYVKGRKHIADKGILFYMFRNNTPAKALHSLIEQWEITNPTANYVINYANDYFFLIFKY